MQSFYSEKWVNLFFTDTFAAVCFIFYAALMLSTGKADVAFLNF